MERGHSSVARKANLSLGRGWAPKFTLSEGDDASAFYYKPLKAAREYPAMTSQIWDIGADLLCSANMMWELLLIRFPLSI